MKKGRIIFGTVITLIVVMLAILPTVSSAATLNPKLYFGVTERKTSDTLKFGYSIGDPGNATTGQKIWNIVKFSSNAYSDPTDTYDIYCIRSGYGFTNGTSMVRNREYTDQFDMKADRGSIGDSQVTALNTRTATVDGQSINSYDAVLALADLFYIPGVSNSGYKAQLLDNANDKYDNIHPYDDMDDAQIQAVQQAALWFYTNSDSTIYTENYAPNKENWLYYTSNGTSYDNMQNYDIVNRTGEDINYQAIALYKYLISEAAERVKAGTYNPKTKVTLYTNLTTNVEQPLIKIEQTGDFDLALRKYITKVNGTAVTNTRVPNIDTGTIDTNGTATYKHRKEPVAVKTGDTVTYKLAIYNEGDIAGVATKIVDQLPTGLVPKLRTGDIVASVDNEYQVTYDSSTNKITLTLVRGVPELGGASTDCNYILPYDGRLFFSEVLEIECEVTATQRGKVFTNVAWIEEEKDENGKVITNKRGDDRDSEPATKPSVNKDNMENYKGHTDNKSQLDDSTYYYKGQQDDDDFEKVIIPAEFDLALRKYITKVDGVALSTANTRVPNIDESTIETTKTATYKHRKDPVEVQIGSKVTYNLTVYNEGDIAGRATEITDQLPTGLKFTKVNTAGYTANYTESTNTVVITKSGTNNIPAYIGTGKPSSETVEIECEVTGTTAGKVFTNVAWISKEVDANGREATNAGVDRDSSTSTKPNVNKDNMEDYKGTTSETDLSKSNTYYPGQQDDDDFEKLIIPVRFDMALRKYITKVDGTAVTNTRVPNIDRSTIATNKTATYKHRKDPVEVQTGSKVIYNLTVYNEGNIAGRASKIVDQLPNGLKFLRVVSGDYTAGTGAYDETTNKVTLTKTGTTNLVAYDGTDLKSETVEIECEVTATKAGVVFTNVAWIEEEIDANGNKATNAGVDIDSSTSKTPNVNKDNMTNYSGNENKTDLSDKDNYYKGQEDDDDFEKVIIPTNFDLALRKYITKVDDKVIENTRTPDIEKSTIDTTKTATYKHRKDPVVVKIGSKVTYNLTVYNEGNVAGRASKIVDQLPTGVVLKVPTGNKVTSTKGNEYTVNYDATANKITLTTTGTKNLAAYDGTTLDSDTIEIECEVTVDAKANKVFTNVAWISEEIDEEGTVITNQQGADRDSQPATKPDVNKDNMEDYKGTTTETDLSKPDKYYPGEQDDDDFEKIIIPGQFDLKLIKRIVEVNGKATGNRITSVDTTKLAAGTETTADYKMIKNPVSVKKGDLVKYTIRVYNEGNMDGYAEEITDDLPEGLEFIAKTLDADESKLSEAEKSAAEYNLNMGWTSFQKDGKTYIKTTYLGKGKGEELTTDGANLIKAFDPTKTYVDTETTRNPDYREISVILKVVSDNSNKNVIRNEAAITQDADEKGNPVEDIDSQPENWTKENSDKHYDENEKWPVYKQDDEDYDNIILQEFDLALRKFITNISGKDVTSRIPTVNYDKNTSKISYTHPKTPLDVVTSDVVTYTIRVFNEGTMDGYATEIMDDMPDGLEFLPENATNKEYRWVMYREVAKDEKVGTDAKTITRGNKTYVETKSVKDATVIVTDYLSKEQEKEAGANLLTAFDSSKEISETNPSHKDVKVAFKVVEPNGSDKILINSAQISEDSDKDGNPVDDIDSKPGEWNEGEDDQDKEYIKLTYFDLALRKWVTESIVIENGKETIKKTGNTAEMDPEPPAKVELHRKKLDKVTVKFRYSIRITNEGDIEGYAKEITDYVPQGLKFVAADNPGWKDEGNNVISTRLLENKLLKPGESAEVTVLLTWINGQDNIGLKTNTAEISEDYNEKGVPDRDSTPDNKKPKEDDIDDAPVLLSVSTGQERIYYVLGFTVLITIAGGIVLIKKFVL